MMRTPWPIVSHIAAMMVFAMAAFGARHGSAEPILIFAASSLSGALDAVVTDYQKTRPADVRLSYSASSTLARQLTRGAPAKIFISANEAWIKFAEHQQALQASSKFVLARNRLVLAAPKGKVTGFTKLTTETLQTALGRGRLVLGDPTHVPAGIYAKEALRSLGLWRVVQHRLAPSINVRAALALLERSEASLGILYKSDVRANGKVIALHTLPHSSHSAIKYVAALTAGDAGKSVLNLFEYFKSRKVTTRLMQFGFDPA